jgi:cell shape-determining protein MreD
MNWLNTIFILLGALLAVFWEADFSGVRNLLGAQVDLLPALMVYASLSSGIGTVAALAVCGGLWLDSLSVNPLGISVLPLFIIGLLIYASRELILRDQVFAQLTLGWAASVAAPIGSLLLLMTTSNVPLIGWGTLWQLIVMGIGGAFATPVIFEVFGWLHRTLGRAEAPQLSFRPDREIRRGR